MNGLPTVKWVKLPGFAATQPTEDHMSFDFLQWYGWAYCLEDFETIALYEEHKKAAYSGWVAATDRLRGGPGQSTN